MHDLTRFQPIARLGLAAIGPNTEMRTIDEMQIGRAENPPVMAEDGGRADRQAIALIDQDGVLHHFGTVFMWALAGSVRLRISQQKVSEIGLIYCQLKNFNLML